MVEKDLSPETVEELRSILAENKEFFNQPIEVLKPRHYRLIEMITTYAGDSLTTSVLELGCSGGEFVDYLRGQGYNAEGVDVNEKAIERSNKIYLHYGDVTCLDNVVGKRTFDLIVATGVFNIGTQIEYLFGNELNMAKKGKVMISPKHGKAALENIEQILRSAFKHLIPSGFLMTVDNISPGDYTAFSPETALSIGYTVMHHAKQEAILQKPLNK